MPADDPQPTRADDDEPDAAQLWQWVAKSVRPYAGWILIGFGALVMLMGYFGVSRESVPAKQIPYLVSGGIGGVFLAVLGAYFLGTQEIRRDSGRLDRLERMVEELHLALLQRPDAPRVDLASAELTSSNGSGSNGSHSSNGTLAPAKRVYVVSDGELFHRAGCALVDDKDTEELTPSVARKDGLRPCPACTPLPATAAS